MSRADWKSYLEPIAPRSHAEVMQMIADAIERQAWRNQHQRRLRTKQVRS